jgi:glycosyltransferase involved in cell wall biosynthesis
VTINDQKQILVSVVIPTFNAEATIAATLRCIEMQTHANLEILVVDDGSTDGSAAIVEEFALRDSRFRLIHQANAGVAAARNAGWDEAKADFIAFVDADDLWTPDKTERQLAALIAGGPKAGLAYSWYVMIDAQDRVVYRGEGPRYAGAVLDVLLTNNFIGNGSAALVRRDAVEAAAGFEPGLRANDAQGCEDILFYCRVAEHYDFVVVQNYQIGYRQLPDAMSTNLPRMLRSWMMVIDEMRSRHPEKEPLLQRGLEGFGRWLFRRAVHQRKPGSIFKLVANLAPRYPKLTARLLVWEVPSATFSMLRWKLSSRDAEPSPAPISAPMTFPVGSTFA